ncbi:MAG: hypothetical protein K6A28_03340 [Bacteroidales bacterium]|nr:hypothetical protein [Bacteroidales bacterium]
MDAIKDNVKEQLSQDKPGQPAPTTQPKQPFTTENVRRPSVSEWPSYFREILQSEFPQYTLKENVAVTDVAGFANDEFQLYKSRPRQAYKAEWGQPYSFVLYQAGVMKAVVMLGSGHSHDENVKYLISRMYAKKCGMPYINFYTQMPNERDYVISRIKRFGV